MLNGEEGSATAKLLELIVALGEVFGAKELVSVESSHISGVSYKNLGDSGLEWLQEQVNLGARARIKATLNPAGMDMETWAEMGIPQKFAQGQQQIIETFIGIGVEPTCTCTPYLIGHIPKFGSQIAWAESSAVCFSNSVIGARTNRESGPTSLASAVTGLAALYGYRLDHNRHPGTIVDVEVKLRNIMDFSALGYVTGKKLGAIVPYFRGLGQPSLEAKKSLGAACATSGGIALWHGEGVTPEAKIMKSHLKNIDKIQITAEDIKEAVNYLTRPLEDPIIVIGCPHLSLNEIAKITRLVKGKNMKNKLWLFTSRGVYAQADREGYTNVIETAGGKIFRDTCMVVAPLKDMGWREVATNSFMAAHYMTNMGMETKIDTIQGLLKGSCL